jgi:hypothetical protein
LQQWANLLQGYVTDVSIQNFGLNPKSQLEKKTFSTNNYLSASIVFLGGALSYQEAP